MPFCEFKMLPWQATFSLHRRAFVCHEPPLTSSGTVDPGLADPLPDGSPPAPLGYQVVSEHPVILVTVMLSTTSEKICE